MTSSTEKKLKQWSLALGLMVIVVPLFVSAVQKDGTVRQNTEDIKVIKMQMQTEQEKREVAERQTQAQLSRIEIDVAVLNTNVQYLVKQYDKDKEAE